MRTKYEILGEVQEALGAGVLVEADLAAFITEKPAQDAAQPSKANSTAASHEAKPDKLSAVDVMFYVAGIVLFSAIMSFIVQSWEGGSSIIHILLSAGIGSLLWALAVYLLKASVQNEIRKGLFNALLLTGSLLLVTGGYIILNEIIGGYDSLNLIGGAVVLAVLGFVHFMFDRFVKREFTLLMAILLSVAAFPVLLFGFMQDSGLPFDVYAAVLILTTGILAYATRVVAKIHPERQKIHSSFDGLAAFLALGSMFAASFGDYGGLWLVLLVVSVMTLFYLSIISQNKHLLGNGSFFLVVTVITISFKYFSGFGVSTCLILSTIGLLGSAAAASTINKRYFKHG